MNIVFIRHGDPDYTIDSLTEKGVREAELLRVRVNKVEDAEYFTSPLGRARRTAEIALQYNDGYAERVSWTAEQTSFDNAFIVLDKNGNRVTNPLNIINGVTLK